VFASLDGVFAVVSEHQVERKNCLDMLAVTRATLDPQLRGAFTDPALMRQCRAATRRWLVALGIEQEATAPAPPTTAPAADVTRATVIARGEIVPLPCRHHRWPGPSSRRRQGSE
jgi:hypothetical protein